MMGARLGTAILLAALSLTAACEKTIDISEQPAMSLPTFGNKPLLRREEVTVRAFFIAKDRAFVELKANCVLTGPQGRIAFQSPKKLLVPVYAGKVPSYKTSCKAVIGASERCAEAIISAKDPTLLATEDNGPTYEPRRGVPFLIK